MQKNSILWTVLTVLIVGAAVYFLKDGETRAQVKDVSKRTAAKVGGKTKEEEDKELNETVGNPDPQDFEDNKMVSEGAQYSVLHYEEAEEKEEEPLRTAKEKDEK